MSPEEVLHQVGNNAAKAWEALQSGHEWTPEQRRWLHSVIATGRPVGSSLPPVGGSAGTASSEAAASPALPRSVSPTVSSPGTFSGSGYGAVPVWPVGSPAAGPAPQAAPQGAPQGAPQAAVQPASQAALQPAQPSRFSPPAAQSGKAGRGSSRKRWPLAALGLVVVAALAVAGWYWLWPGGDPAPQPDPAATAADAPTTPGPASEAPAPAPTVQAPAPPVLRAGFGSYICSSKGQGVQCWGARKDGEKVALAPVAGLENVKVVALSVGRSFATAVAEDGTVYAWGINDVGQLGAGEASGSESALTVGTLPGRPTQLVSGTEHTCALVADAVYCFGSNRYGQVNGVASNGPTGVTQVPGVSGAVQIGTSGYDSWAATAEGIWSWGNNNWGQVTDGAEKVVPPTFTADK